jgi:hypothetical protein
MENDGKIYDHVEYFGILIWHILWQFGIVYGHLVCFSRFGRTKKNVATLM